MNRAKYLEAIASYLARLKSEVSLNSKINFFSIHKASEDFTRELFNLVYDSDLKNINIAEPNTPAIDLADEHKKISIQVTGESSSAKINKTISKFLEKELYKKYEELFIVLLVDKKKYTSKFDTKNKFVFDPSKHIKDSGDVLKDISSKNLDKIEKIYDFLKSEFDSKPSRENTVANEVETIMSLIELLSSEASDKKMTLKETDPDPEKKILKRFSNYSSTLVSEIQNLIPEYQAKRDEAESSLGLDSVKYVRIREYLKWFSDATLRDCNGDPIASLDKLTLYFYESLSKSGRKFDNGAIRYYIIDQIIKCNVFPNEKLGNK